MSRRFIVVNLNSDNDHTVSAKFGSLVDSRRPTWTCMAVRLLPRPHFTETLKFWRIAVMICESSLRRVSNSWQTGDLNYKGNHAYSLGATGRDRFFPVEYQSPLSSKQTVQFW